MPEVAPELEEMKPEGFLVVRTGPGNGPGCILAACAAEKVNLPSGTVAPVVFLLPEAAARGAKQLLDWKDIFIKNGGGLLLVWYYRKVFVRLAQHNFLEKINNHPYGDIELS